MSTFWHSWQHDDLDLFVSDKNTTSSALFTFDIIKSFVKKERDYLIHARIAHLNKASILQLVSNGSTGLPYSGKFLELCRPCIETRQRAGDHGKEHERHPHAKIGEYLHSDLAIVNYADYGGFTMVLTVMDEVSDEVITFLLNEKTAVVVLKECK